MVGQKWGWEGAGPGRGAEGMSLEPEGQQE